MKKILTNLFEFSERKFTISIAFIIFIFCVAIYSLGNYHANKNYPGQWFLSFSDIPQKNLAFEIKNSGPENKFSWVLTSGKNKKVAKGEIIIESDNIQEIQPQIDYTTLQEGKWKITVTDLEGEKMEIYKRF